MKRNRDTTSSEKHTIKGHDVEIRKKQDTEELWIDGVRRKFFVNKNGYTLHDAAYDPPFKSLREAVESYLEKYPNPNPTHHQQ